MMYPNLLVPFLDSTHSIKFTYSFAAQHYKWGVKKTSQRGSLPITLFALLTFLPYFRNLDHCAIFGKVGGISSASEAKVAWLLEELED